MQRELGFFSSLFDVSFSSFITTKLIKALYTILAILSAIGAIIFIVTGFQIGVFVGILFLLLSPLVFLFNLILARVYCELIIVLFRIAEHVQHIAER